MAANNSYQEAVALIASANRVVQDPNSVGAALRTISLRLRGTSTEQLEETGEDTDGAITSKSKLRSKIKGYTGIDILTDSGTYKSTYEILLEISKVWDNLTDINRAGLLEIIAGKTRSNTAAAILSNTKDLEEAYKSAMNAEGSALAENEKYLDSIQGRIDLFNNAIQTMWNTEIDSGVIKFFVDFATSLVKIVDNLGLINTLVFGLMSYFTIFRKKGKLDLASMLGIHDVEKGWFYKKKGKKDSPISDVPAEFKISAQEYGEAIGDNIQDYVKIDTAEIDSQIDQVQRKLDVARQHLTDAKSKDWNYYKSFGSKTPAKDRDNRINEATTEVKKLEGELNKLEAQKNQLLSSGKENYINSLFGTPEEIKQTNTKFLNIFENGLGKGATEKLNVDFDKLSGMLKDLDGLDGEGLRNYMLNLGDLGDEADDTTIALAGYASTVEDGNYSIQGAQRYVREYNQSLASMSKQAATAQLKQNLLNLAISALTMALSYAIGALINYLASAQSEFEELSSQLSSTKSDLEGINSELDETSRRIEELQNQGSLSFTEQEELDRLKAQNEELKIQKGLKEAIQKQQQKGANSATVNAVNDYYKNTGKDTGKTTGELAGEGAKYGLMVGGAAAGVVASSLAVGASNIWNPIGWAALVLAGVTLLGTGIGAAVGAFEEKVGESLDNMREQHIKLQEEYNAAQKKYASDVTSGNYEDMQEAQEKLTEYESMMANHLSKMDAYYSQIDLSVYDPIEDAEEIKRLRKEMNDFYDTQDKWLIQSGDADAKNNAITRIFGENASDELKSVKRDVENAAKKAVDVAKETGNELDFSVDLSKYMNSADLDTLTTRLHEMGIYVYEVENYFKDMAQAEKEAAEVSLYDVVTDINKITEGLGSLNGAFDEVIESGSASAKTLAELNEVFGTLGDSWNNYVNTMFSGVASTKEMQEATEQLAKAFIDSKILTGEAISEYERMSYIIQLRNLGVINAEEYVDDKIQENTYKAMQNSAKYDKDEILDKWLNASDEDKTAYKEKLGITKTDFYELSTEELDKLAEYYDLSKEINAETAQEIADQYGLEIDNLNEVIDLLEKKAEKEKDAANAKKKQDEYQEWLNADDGYNKLKEKIDKTSDDVKNFDASKYQLSQFIGKEDKYMYLGKSYTSEEFEEMKRRAKEYQDALKKFEELKNSEKGKKWINEDGTLKEGVEAEFKAAYDTAQKGVKNLEDQIETELTADIKLKLELQDQNKAIDDIQSVFDSLKNAQKEYAESGYLSINTMQELLGLSPRYLTLLYDENGQLNLNEDALYRVAEARITDMGIAQQNAIVEQALELATSGSRDALLEYTDATYNAVEATESLVESQLKLLKTALTNRTQDQKEQQTRTVRGRDGKERTETITVVTKVADLTEEEAAQIYGNVEKAVNAVNVTTQKTLAGVRKGGMSDTAKSEVDSAFEKAMKYWENRIGANQARYEQIQHEIDLLEKQGKIAGEGYYQEQIKLENERLKLLEAQKAEAKKFLGTFKTGSDQWWEVANQLNDKFYLYFMWIKLVRYI